MTELMTEFERRKKVLQTVVSKTESDAAFEWIRTIIKRVEVLEQAVSLLQDYVNGRCWHLPSSVKKFLAELETERKEGTPI